MMKGIDTMPSNYKTITEHNEDQLGKDTSSRKTQVSMYSDSTHFVYEILQNADDHDATEVFFKLSEDKVVIEHNGEPFKEKHVKAITYFGKGTSREDLVKTGRFGIGFKSVFAFTATPIIISWPEHFQIYGLYRVREYPYPDGFTDSRTRIILPFNHESEHPDFVEKLMTQEEAYQQISECLTNLNMNTLLFTRNIREITWEIGNQSACYRREDEIENNSRLTTITDGDRENRYLVFSKVPTWENEEHKAVEIAFAIDERDQITSIDDDNLYVLFPTTEKTGLRFLLNGPYRTNPARETVSKTDDFNVHLMEVTCELMQELLPKLKKRKLLNLQFLSVLPNKEDELTHVSNRLQLALNLEEKPRGFYSPLHNVIVNEFRNQKLTPTKRKDFYAPAKDLYRGTREMSEVIEDNDLALLLGKDHHLPLWVKNLPPRERDDKGRFIEDENATKRNKRINDFLDTLDIPEWDVEDLIKVLESEDEPIIEWLKRKTNEWYQDFYAFLDDSPSYYVYELSKLRIVRCIDGEYRTGDECHFPSDDIEPDQDLSNISTTVDEERLPESQEEEHEDEEGFHYVANAVYMSGNRKDIQEKVRKFLETIGVEDVTETERIKLILKQRYVYSTIKLRQPYYKQDLERFIKLVEDEPDKALLFENYHIFEGDKWWSQPNRFFLDLPYCNTGLTVYHENLDEDSKYQKLALSQKYKKYGIDLERLTKFAEAVGAQTKLEAIKQPISRNDPNLSYLIEQAEGQWRYNTGNSEDYFIPELKILYAKPSIEKSKLIWRTMFSLPEKYLKAWYWNNNIDKQRDRPPGKSSLVHKLMKEKWVPQKDGSFVCPSRASIDQLLKGFLYEPGQEWLEAIEFGKETREQKEEHDQRNQQAKNWGFDSSEEVEKFAELRQLLNDGEITVDDLIFQYRPQNREYSPDFPTSPVRNPIRRSKGVLEQIRNAPEKEHVEKIRNVRETKEDIDQKTTLEKWYSNETNEMICQICKKEMPFKRTDGKYYFVAMEALTIKFKSDELPEYHFPKEFVAQYLALCPECAARFDYFVRTIKDGETVMKELRNHLINSEDMEFPLTLGELKTSIRFVETHFHDLKRILHYYENPDEAEDSTD